MIEIQGAKDHGKIIAMDEMASLDIGLICESPNDNGKGHIILRTASTDKFEIMDLTDPGVDCCWTRRPDLHDIKVFIPTKTIFTIKISNAK